MELSEIVPLPSVGRVYEESFRVRATFGLHRLRDVLSAKDTIAVPHDKLDTDGFVVRLNPAADTVEFATFLGGSARTQTTSSDPSVPASRWTACRSRCGRTIFYLAAIVPASARSIRV